MNEERRGERGELLPEPNEGPPDSQGLQGQCPRCLKQSSFEQMTDIPVTWDYERQTVNRQGNYAPIEYDRVVVLLCRNCEQGVVVVEECWIGDQRYAEQQEFPTGTMTWHGVHWWPIPGGRVSSDIPEQIAEAYKEAVRALAANCPRASAVMARRTLEAVTEDRGEDSGSLAGRLNSLADAGELHPQLSEWATEIRLIGNTGAHFDPIDTVTDEDADDLLQFLNELLRYLYEFPAEMQRRRANR